MYDEILRGLVYGTVIGALAASWFTIGNGSWVTVRTVEQMKADASNEALMDAFSDICFAIYQATPDRADHAEKLKKLPVYKQRQYIAYRGWSVMPGAERPFRNTSDACQVKIAETF